MKWKERKYILKSSDKHRHTVYPVGYCLSVLESRIFFALSCYCCSFLCLSSPIAVFPWIHYWKHYSISKRFIFFFPLFFKAMAASKACRELRCSWLFSALLSSNVLRYHSPLILLVCSALWTSSMGVAGQPASRPASQPVSPDYLRFPIPKTLRSTVTNTLKICWWPLFLTNWVHYVKSNTLGRILNESSQILDKNL